MTTPQDNDREHLKVLTAAAQQCVESVAGGLATLAATLRRLSGCFGDENRHASHSAVAADIIDSFISDVGELGCILWQVVRDAGEADQYQERVNTASGERPHLVGELTQLMTDMRELQSSMREEDGHGIQASGVGAAIDLVEQRLATLASARRGD